MRLWPIFLGLELAAALPALAADCPAAQARYAPAAPGMGTAELVLTVAEVPSAQTDLSLVVIAPGLALPLALEMIQANGYGSMAAFPVGTTLFEGGEEGERGFPLMVFRADPAGRLIAEERVPQGADPAPDAILVEGLGAALWYATGAEGPRVDLRPGLFYRAACG
jgi:hypothetical protein